MDHSWRPPPLPPIPGSNNTICPICSISHFPFCPPPPPPPPFIENPRSHYSQPQNVCFNQRPHFDHHHPFPNHQSSLNYNYDYNPSDARRPTWYGSNPSLDMSPYDGNYINHQSGGVGPGSYGYEGYDYGGIKRMKIELIDNNRGSRGSSMGGDNERILKLIHDHGNAANATPGGLPKVGVDLFTESSSVNADRFAHERFRETCEEVRDDLGLKRRREMNNVQYDYSRHSSQPTIETLHENYHNLQSNVAIVKEPNYSHLGQSQLPVPADTMQHHLHPNHNLLSSRLPTDINQPVDLSKGHYAPNYFGRNFGAMEVHHGYGGQPPLSVSPPPPPPIDQPRNHFFEPLVSPPAKKPSLFPVAVSSSSGLSSSHSAIPENQSSAQVYYTNNASHHASNPSSSEEFHARQSSFEKHVRDVQPFPLQHLSSEKPNIIDASHIFKQPHRTSRPDHFVIILRGLPGSGKSYLAKLLRDIEIENGGEAPRIHSMDEYFMTEVEKAEDSELSKSSGSLRGRRQIMKKVMEYCYEPEMEEAYRASMLKAFKKTLDEGVYSFIIVDDRNLRVADFAQFWATAKRSGYEVYIVEAAYKDPAGCAARNVHNFTLDDIQKMAGQWEEAPSLYLKMDVKSILHGDGFDESGIQEVDMDMEDDDAVDASLGSDVKSPPDNVKDKVDDFTPHDADPLKDVKHLDTKEEVSHLSRSKWSNDLDENESIEAKGGKKKGSALSGLIQAYSKEGKSVWWGDQGGNVGFSISATRKTNTRSLVIGPGPGYNLKSNPLSEEEYLKPARNAVDPKSQNVFQEQIRAERESFKAVFDKRRQRISRFNMDEE